jgi:hypothetical protein
MLGVSSTVHVPFVSAAVVADVEVWLQMAGLDAEVSADDVEAGDMDDLVKQLAEQILKVRRSITLFAGCCTGIHIIP